MFRPIVNWNSLHSATCRGMIQCPVGLRVGQISERKWNQMSAGQTVISWPCIQSELSRINRVLTDCRIVIHAVLTGPQPDYIHQPSDRPTDVVLVVVCALSRVCPSSRSVRRCEHDLPATSGVACYSLTRRPASNRPNSFSDIAHIYRLGGAWTLDSPAEHGGQLTADHRCALACLTPPPRNW